MNITLNLRSGSLSKRSKICILSSFSGTFLFDSHGSGEKIGLNLLVAFYQNEKYTFSVVKWHLGFVDLK